MPHLPEEEDQSNDLMQKIQYDDADTDSVIAPNLIALRVAEVVSRSQSHTAHAKFRDCYCDAMH